MKNYLVPLPAFPGADCTQTPQNCTPRFPPAQKDSYHYVVFGDAVGGASWSLADGSLSSVVASGNTVTFTTSAAFPTGMPVNTHEGVCPNGRVTISDAITNPSLNGTYCVQSFDSNHFTISSPVTKANYTHSTDPNLAVSTGEATSRSGTSDLGGAGSLITLGLWGADGQSTTVQAGTLMHELGHTFYLPHGGAYYDNPATPYVPTFEANCKPNYQSVMSYLFQVDLLDIFDPQNKTLLQGGHLDFSGQTLTTLQESSLNNVAALQTNSIPLQPPTYAGTKWYAPGPQVGTPATRFCDGTPFAVNQPPFPMYRLDGLASSISPAWTINQNIDFGPNTTPATTLRGFNDWASLDLRQIGATGSAYVLGGAFPRGGGAFPRGGGAFPTGGGAFPSGGGAFPRGGGAFPRGGGASGDITHETANSVTRSPRNLTATEAQSPRTVTLNWTPPTFGQISTYNVYRSKDGGQTFQMIAQVSGNPPATTYPDTTLVCTNSPTDYQYFVTAVLANTLQESVPSNIVPAGDPITGCYTLSGYSSPAPNASAPAGNVVPITFEVQDDFYAKGGVVSSLGPHNTLRAIGPIPHDGSCSTLAQPPAVQNFVGTYPYSVTTLSAGGAGLTFAANRFTYNWNTATSLGAGCYFFELDLDSNQFEQSGAFTLLIFESGPTITTTTLPNGIVGSTYNSTLTELGGIPPLTWSVSSGGLPLGINLNSSTGALSGTPTAPGIFNYTVQVTDSKGNFSTLGTPQLSITVASSGQPASSLSVLVNGPAKTAVAYVAKGSWNAGNGGPGGGPGISVVNIEGSSVTNAAVPTALDVVNSCASNALTGATVCTADDNVVYILNGTTVSGMVTSGATGLGGIAFQGGQCTTCGVVMDSVHNQALIAVTDNAPTGGFQFLNLNTVPPALGAVFQSEAVSNTPANISPSVLLDPTRSTANPSGNTSYGSGAIVLSAGESGNFEIVDVTNPASPGFFENMPPGLGLAFHLPPGSSGEDTSTGIALAPIETTNPSQVYIADLTQASFTSGTPGSWSTMASQVQLLTESMNLSASGAGGIAVAQGNTHTGVITGDVGGNAITAILLPSTSGGGTPAITDWVTCTIPAPPSNALFAMGYDPHTMTAYQSPTSNDAIVVIADQSGPNNGPGYLAVLDLTMMLNTTTVPRTAGGHGCASGALPASVVSFIAVP